MQPTYIIKVIKKFDETSLKNKIKMHNTLDKQIKNLKSLLDYMEKQLNAKTN